MDSEIDVRIIMHRVMFKETIGEEYVELVHHQDITVETVLKTIRETINGTVVRGRLLPSLRANK